MSALHQRQDEFSGLVARLIQKAHSLGYQVTLGEAYRPPETAEIYARQGRGIRRSLHCDRLAVDLNLFKDGRYLTASADYEELGEWWESVGGNWGGRFGDGNHFSLGMGDGRK